MANTVDYPICLDSRECFAREGNHCLVLTSCDFGGKPCPFCKSRTERRLKMMDARLRLLDLGREDLIKKYKYNLEV